MKSLSLWMAAVGGVLVWVAVPPLVDVYGSFSIGVGCVYVVSVVIVFAALAVLREVGLFLSGGFVIGCIFGAAICWSEIFVGGICILFPMAGLVLGAIGATLACVSGTIQQAAGAAALRSAAQRHETLG